MPNSINYTAGGARQDLTGDPAATVDALKTAGELVSDSRLAKPSYFDGRFLTANDLTREQTYMLTRQSDVASTYRGGVLRGMTLAQFGNVIRIDAGAGFTPSGQLVTLASGMQVSITAVPEDDRIDLSNGLVDVAEPPAATRSGLYVLGLRPDEYASNPITRYPLSVRGSAGVSDGDIVEVAALALHPMAFSGTGSADQLRGELARAMFLDGATGLPADLLALAIVELTNGSITWLDQFLVRRDIAAEDGAIVGLGTVDRGLREAQFLQYDAQMSDLVAQLRTAANLQFPASRYFSALPPVGRMPVAAIDQTELTQAFFPSEMTVELSVVVDTEVPALLEASFHLPPLDLTGGDDDFDNAYVQVLIPMPAAQLAQLQLAAVVVPRTITPLPVLQRRLPLTALTEFMAARTLATTAATTGDLGTSAPPVSAPLLAAWRSALASAPNGMVWFVRVPALSIAPATLFDAAVKVGKETKEIEKAIEKPIDKIKDTKEVEKAKDTKEVEKAKDTKEIEKGKDTKEVEKAKDTKEIEKGKDTAEKPQLEKLALAEKAALAEKVAAIEKTLEKVVAEKAAALEKVAEKAAALEKVAEKRLETKLAAAENVLRPAVTPVVSPVLTPAITPTPVANTPVKTFITNTERPAVTGNVLAPALLKKEP